MADDVRWKSVPSIGNGLHGPQLPHAPAPSLVNVSMPSHLLPCSSPRGRPCAPSKIAQIPHPSRNLKNCRSLDLRFRPLVRELATRRSSRGGHYRRGGSALVNDGLKAAASCGRKAIIDVASARVVVGGRTNGWIAATTMPYFFKG
jgi:hypothetical protein